MPKGRISEAPFPVVGIGASAGGLRAIKEFLAYLPAQTGMAYVIIQHLSPNFKSLMKEILEKDTTLPVEMAEEGMRVEPNRVYLIPAGYDLTISAKTFSLSSQKDSKKPHFAIDVFLHSLGLDCGANAIGVILSGTGTDGSRGIRTIKEKGGIVIVQEPMSGEFDGMPLSAIDTKVVDLILEPGQIARKLGELGKMFLETGGSLREMEDLIESLDSTEVNLAAILGEVEEVTGIDFTVYKSKTIRRRLEKHLKLHAAENADDYLEVLKSDTEEVEALANEFLIGVTDFFRDRDAFKALEERIFPKIIDANKKAGQIRIWVSACSTGEEVYTLAIMLHEYGIKHSISFDYIILATDVSEKFLKIAGRGVYQANQLTKLPFELQERYFIRDGDMCEISSQIRSKIIFARNDLTCDPPFINIDLALCRNLLIYFRPFVQRRVLMNMHFGLKDSGFLMLGKSENILDLDSHFDIVSDKWKLFQARQGPDRRKALLGLDSAMRTGKRGFVQFKAFSQSEKQKDRFPNAVYTRIMLERYPFPFVLVTSDLELVFSGGKANRFLQVPDMAPYPNILNMVSQESSLVIRDGVRRLEVEEGPFFYSGINVSHADSNTPNYTLRLDKIHQPTGEHLFEVRWLNEEPNADLEGGTKIQLQSQTIDSSEVIDQLRNDLKVARQEVQNSLEELESSNEELQAANEELLASNEELQSTNEELQSVNEELYTVNTELQLRNSEMVKANMTIDHLLSSTDIGTLQLDEELRITFFTPAIHRVVSLTEGDIGEKIERFSLQWEYPAFFEHAKEVMESLEPIEEEILSKSGEHIYLVRIFPHKGEAIKGAVIAIIDITELKKIERSLKASMQNQKRILTSLPYTIWKTDLEGSIVYVNQGQEDYSADKLIGTSFFSICTEDTRDTARQAFKSLIDVRQTTAFQAVHYTPTGTKVNNNHIITPLFDADGKPEEILVMSRVSQDIREVSEADFQQAQRFNDLFFQSDLIYWIKDFDYSYQFISPSFARLLRKPTESIIDSNDYAIFAQKLAQDFRHRDEIILREKKSIVRLDKYELGNYSWQIIGVHFPLQNPGEEVKIGHVGILLNDALVVGTDEFLETQQKLEEIVEARTEALMMVNQELRTIARSMAHDLRTPLRAIQSFGQMLQEELEDSNGKEHSPEYLGHILQQSRKMANIVDGLISYVKIGSIEVRKQWVDMKTVANETWGELKHLLDTEEAEFNVHNCPNIWADQFLLKQVLSNLVSNSIKYRSKQEPLKIDFGAYKDDTGKRWVYYIKDNGIGFDPKDSRKVFDVFERLHQSVGIDGYGIGLSIVKKSIEIQNGKIWVNSELGSGATFYFYLPAEG